MENPVEVGKFGAVFGVNGWIKVHSFTERLESIFEYQPWFIKEQGEWCEIQISEWKHHGNGLIVKLVGIDQREIAQQKTNLSIFVEESYGKKERLIPLVFGDIIKEFDKEKKTMVVAWDPDF